MVMPTDATIPRPTAMRLDREGEDKFVEKFPKLNVDLIKLPNLVFLVESVEKMCNQDLTKMQAQVGL